MAKRPTDARNTWAWRRLRDQVVKEEPYCWLRLPCCTGLSTTADHVLTVKERPDLILERTNLRGACRACNNSRKDRTIEELGLVSRSWVM
jgi:5-methylcytosine-specific restriction endonuclease McrA